MKKRCACDKQEDNKLNKRCGIHLQRVNDVGQTRLENTIPVRRKHVATRAPDPSESTVHFA